MLVRRILFVLLISVAPVIGVLPATPAMAASVITSSFDKAVTHPGETVTLSVTFTNPETVDVTFTYLTVNQSYDTMTDGTKYSQTSCTGEITSCNHYTVPIPPGGTRTLKLTYEIATDSPCGENIGVSVYYYSYRESTAGTFDGVEGGPAVTVLC
ncbi:DUF11 domain-containing protein [Actinomadura rubrisoli]|uniref:DUF11 domain-containing protein n=1 Tax=Actinomadura rubrisoli TaxID=2530368 RepID=A0A4R5A279_9ACTN|nr:DUF11 domain-containing protein [Actinomadura rubrisoli]TDD63572.1 DUF11 domain-containing protein [Actinomadura rubrisoli]